MKPLQLRVLLPGNLALKRSDKIRPLLHRCKSLSGCLLGLGTHRGNVGDSRLLLVLAKPVVELDGRFAVVPVVIADLAQDGRPLPFPGLAALHPVGVVDHGLARSRNIAAALAAVEALDGLYGTPKTPKPQNPKTPNTKLC